MAGARVTTPCRARALRQRGNDMIDLHKLGIRFAAASALSLALLIPASPAQAQVQFGFEYAAKVVCGRLSEESGILAGGRYFTAVNVHNPGRTATLRRKVAVAGPGEAGRVSSFQTMRLRNDEALEIDCKLIQRQADTEWVKGFLVIQSSHELDVVAVYTTSSGAGVNSFHTERVPMRRMPQ
jgi:hypothetical protein